MESDDPPGSFERETASSPPVTAQEFDEIIGKMSDLAFFEDAHARLRELFQDPTLWKYVIRIYNESSSDKSKFYILTYFSKFIRRNWSTIPVPNREYFMLFFYQSITSSESISDALVSVQNSIMVEILKREWPMTWPSFIRDLISSGKSQRNSQLHIMSLLSRLSQEIHAPFGLSLSSDRRNELDCALSADAPLVIQFFTDFFNDCAEIPSVVLALTHLKSFLAWINPAHVQFHFLRSLTLRMFPIDALKQPILLCFAAIPKSSSDSPLLDQFVEASFQLLIDNISTWLYDGFPFNELCEQYPDISHSLVLALTEYIAYGSYDLTLRVDSDISATKAIIWMLELTETSTGPAFELCLSLWEEISRQNLTNSSTVHLPYKYFERLQEILVRRLHAGTEADEQTKSISSILLDTSKVSKCFILEYLSNGINEAQNEAEIMQLLAAISSLSGSLTLSEENRFIGSIIQSIKPHSFVEANLMLATAFPRYMISQPNLLKSYYTEALEYLCGNGINKKFILDQLSTISTSCRSALLSPCSEGSFINTLFGDINILVQKVDFDLLPRLFFSFGWLIKGLGSESLVDNLLLIPLSIWKASKTADQMAISIRLFSSLFEIGDSFINGKLIGFIEEASNLFKGIVASDEVSASIKGELYALFANFLKAGTDKTLENSIIQTIISDYKSMDPSLRDNRALSCIEAYLINGEVDGATISQIVNDIIIETVRNIAQNYNPEIGRSVFSLLSLVFRASFTSVENLGEGVIAGLFDVIYWGLSLENEETVELALNIVLMIVDGGSEEFSSLFYRSFYRPLLTALLRTLLSVNDETVFGKFCRVICVMIGNLSKSGDTAESAAQMISCQLIDACGGAERERVYDFVLGVLVSVQDFKAFKSGLHDLIVEFGRGDFRKMELEEEDFEMQQCGIEAISNSSHPPGFFMSSFSKTF